MLHICNLFDVHLRTGCFCNPGACQRHLKMSVEELEKQFEVNNNSPGVRAIRAFFKAYKV